MELSFRYIKEKGVKGEVIFRPKIPITFYGKNHPHGLDVLCLIDSGSDVMIIPKSHVWNEVLIGRVPFFQYFKITFNENKKRVYLTRTKHR